MHLKKIRYRPVLMFQVHRPDEEETLLNAGHLLPKSPSLIQKREISLRKNCFDEKNIEEASKLSSRVERTKNNSNL